MRWLALNLLGLSTQVPGRWIYLSDGPGQKYEIGKHDLEFNVLPLDEVMARQVGSLLAKTRLADVIDAAVVIIANNGDRILTSDPDDLYTLASASGRRLDVVTV